MIIIMNETSIFAILVSAIFIDNFVLQKFMGICPFLGVSKKIQSAVGMGVAVIFVMVCATIATWPVYTYLLAPFGLEYLRTVAFILLIALFVQLVEMILKKFVPPLYSALGVYLPLITTNCAVLGVTLLNIDQGYSFGQSIVNSLGAGIGFTVALLLFSGVRMRIENSDVATMFKGVPITLVSAAIVSLSFMGFAGMI